MAKFKDWISAFRLKTLPLAISSIIAGSSLAIYEGQGFAFNIKPYYIFGLAVLTAILLQVLSNLANDYGDFIKGTDNDERIGPERALQSGKITKQQMLSGLVICAFLALCSGLALIYFSFSEINSTAWIYIGLGLLSIGAAINYTVGKNPYGYMALGDVFVFIFFGLVGVLGPYYLIRHEMDLSAIFLAISFGLFSVMVLNLNNMRDIVNDEKSNKITVPVLLGLDKARLLYHPSLTLLAWACILMFFVTVDVDSLILLFLATPFFIGNLKFTLKNKDPKGFDPELKKVALGTFLLSILIWIGLLINYQFPEL